MIHGARKVVFTLPWYVIETICWFLLGGGKGYFFFVYIERKAIMFRYLFLLLSAKRI